MCLSLLFWTRHIKHVKNLWDDVLQNTEGKWMCGCVELMPCAGMSSPGLSFQRRVDLLDLQPTVVSTGVFIPIQWFVCMICLAGQGAWQPWHAAAKCLQVLPLRFPISYLLGGNVKTGNKFESCKMKQQDFPTFRKGPPTEIHCKLTLSWHKCAYYHMCSIV